jgi:hypothetical protein
MLNNFGILNSNSLISLAFIHDCSDYMFRIYCQPFCFIFMSSVGSSAISILLYVECSFIPSFHVRLVFLCYKWLIHFSMPCLLQGIDNHHPCARLIKPVKQGNFWLFKV